MALTHQKQIVSAGELLVGNLERENHMSWMTRLSALEVMAFTMLPEKARIARLAYLCRTQPRIWESPTSLASAKMVLARIGEPHGKKGKLAKALRQEFDAQSSKATIRRQRSYDAYDGGLGTNWLGQKIRYDPVSFRFHQKRVTVRKHDRVKAICLSRFAEYTTFSSQQDILPGVTWWNFNVTNWAVNHAEIRDGSYFIQVKPYSWCNSAAAKKRQWLLYKTKGGIVGSVRIPRKIGKSADDAINSLKTSGVKKAEKAGATVEIDWINKAFIVQSLRRKRAKSVPFKRHERKKKVER
jgi:hypothetical protein